MKTAETAKKRGPKPKPPAKVRSERLVIPVTPTEHQDVCAMADDAGVTIADLVRVSLGLK